MQVNIALCECGSFHLSMRGWLLWTLLFASSNQDPPLELHLSGPQNVRGSHDNKQQTISISWQDDPASSRLQGPLKYEVEILLTDNMKEVHRDSVAVTPDQAGSDHQWTWTSPLPLECASHSVRLRSLYLDPPNPDHTSPWWQHIIPGRESLGSPQVFPKDRVYRAGSNITVCCILGNEQEAVSMKYHGKTMNTTHIGGPSHAMTVLNAQSLSKRCINFNCKDPRYGACVYVGYPPDDRDLVCETRDLETAECRWTTGKPTNLTLERKTTYHLNGRKCPNNTVSNCRQALNIDLGETKWTLTAENPLGRVEVGETADLRRRVRMLAPANVAASVVASREARVEWAWQEGRYLTLRILCDVQLSSAGSVEERNYSGEGLGSVVLHRLTPAQTYAVRVRCAHAEHFWKWGDYSRESTFRTQEDYPDAVDVWMKTEKKKTMIVWKPLLANQSNGQILDYQVTWETAETTERHSIIVHHQPSTNHHPVLTQLLGASDQSYVVTVTARNSQGRSRPSTISIPRFTSERVVDTKEILGSDGGFDLSWLASADGNHGYAVEWCPSYGECGLEWMKVPAGVTWARVQSDSFREGVKYTLSIYGVSAERGPALLERREGFVKECIPMGTVGGLSERQTGSEVQISWTGIPPGNQRAFIRGYNVTYVDNTHKTSHSVTTGPEATSVTIPNLRSRSYTFTVSALTSAGTTDGSSTTVYITQDEQLITVILLSLGATFFLLFLATVLCYRYRTCLKHELYPDIPKPVWKGAWDIPEGRCPVLRVSSCPGCEIDFAADPVGEPGPPEQENGERERENGEREREKSLLTNNNSDTPPSPEYYNHPQSESSPASKTPPSPPPVTVCRSKTPPSPPPVTVCRSKTPPSPPPVTASQFRGVDIQNPSYDALELTKTNMELSLDYQPHMGAAATPLPPALD